ncbi:MAG: MOSC domain-containing protein [Verrucomicrobia bacterium]|nr:MOSC domain-containing protein [Verrucomicrobiota bacterium]
MHLSGLFLYPVKSLGGFAVESATLDPLGIVGDRRFLVVDETGRFLTQRGLPRMALVGTALDATHLTLSTSPAQTLRVALASDPAAPLRTVSIWKSENLLAEDCGDAPAQFLSDFLGAHCRLVRIGEKFSRPVLKAAARPGDLVTFADACPLLVIGESSLVDLNDRLAEQGEEAVPMNRFRPNLVISGCPAHAEDAWTRFQLGTAIFRSAGPCVRCLVPNTDQATAERGKEPLRTLATYRRAPASSTDVIFGQNLINETKSGAVRVGDAVKIL